MKYSEKNVKKNNPAKNTLHYLNLFHALSHSLFVIPYSPSFSCVAPNPFPLILIHTNYMCGKSWPLF